ncbi:unnamed protein product, partial [Brugia timori]|uniref:AB hydrolase-1 domain-containing protein n=1 Tax=Brugia timori TaxID=42155 RepID=A0A0R3R6B0_9BILA
TVASIDAVIQYAIHKLGFEEEQIVIYAWSIGGFPATWAAANYPNIKLTAYNGPLVLIRRTQDEMIITTEGTSEERLATNRANNLLKSILRARHPNLINDDDAELAVDVWLAATPLERISLTKDCPKTLAMDNIENLTKQNRNILIHCLCSKYLVDFDSSHNTPLDLSLFTVPSSF